MKLVQPWGRKGVMNYVFVYPSWSHINLLCGHTHAYTNIYILTYVHTYIHTCFLACLHTYIHTYLQVPFEEALELVRTRRVYLESGMAFVPRDEMISITVGAFRSRLSAALTVCVCVCACACRWIIYNLFCDFSILNTIAMSCIDANTHLRFHALYFHYGRLPPKPFQI